jgi:trk system potassium uptake protein TrkA
MKEEEQNVHFLEGYSIAEIKPPKSFIGKSIRDLNIRVKFGVDVLSIKTKTESSEKITAIPNPQYIIKENDTLVVAGEIRNINLLKNMI